MNRGVKKVKIMLSLLSFTFVDNGKFIGEYLGKEFQVIPLVLQTESCDVEV